MKIKDKFEDLWRTIRYYIYCVPRGWCYDIKYFIENLIFFRKELWNYRNWDVTYNLSLFAHSLEGLANQIENGQEEERFASKKVERIRELISLIRLIGTDYGIEEESYSHKKYLDARGRTLNRIHRILKGQSNFTSPIDYEEWVEQFDGTGLEGWWE